MNERRLYYKSIGSSVLQLMLGVGTPGTWWKGWLRI